MDIDPPSSSTSSVEAAHGSLSTHPTTITESNSNSLAMDLPQEMVYSLVMKWRGTAYELSVKETDTVVRFH